MWQIPVTAIGVLSACIHEHIFLRLSEWLTSKDLVHIFLVEHFLCSLDFGNKFCASEQLSMESSCLKL
jgi:hypothetical protein